jgi:hypothetical protein
MVSEFYTTTPSSVYGTFMTKKKVREIKSPPAVLLVDLRSNGTSRRLDCKQARIMRTCGMM